MPQPLRFASLGFNPRGICNGSAPVFEHIDHNYSSPITVQEVAARVHMSKSRFMRFFKQVTGQSFITYLNQFRVSRAQTSLKTTDKSIAGVSEEVGFCDPKPLRPLSAARNA